MKQFNIILFLITFIGSNIILADKIKPMSVKEKKKNFISKVIPAIKATYKILDEQYDDISSHINDARYKYRILSLKKLYKVKTNQELLIALKPHPKSIAIAQAAIESAWATSRFCREANNLFGVWSSKKTDLRIAAGIKRGNKTIWLKKYTTIEASVMDYYITISRSKAFKEFRILNMLTDNPYALALKLDLYSEKGKIYTQELIALIKYNKFYLYD